MKQFLLLLLSAVPLLLASCSLNDHVAYNPGGNYVHDRNLAFGGTGSWHGNDGSGWTYDNQGSFQVGAQTVGVGVGGWMGVKNLAQKELTARTINTNAALTAQQKAALDAAAAQGASASQLEAYKAALQAGAAPTVGTVKAPGG